MNLALVLTSTLCLCVSHITADPSPSDHGSKPVFFNVASRSNVTATSTCGEGGKPTVWCPFTFTGNDLGFGCDECDASNPEKRHPISFAVDGHKTWWQSETFPGEVNVTVDLKQNFYIASVVLKIGPSLPPRNWILEKSQDGVIFSPWQYFAGTPSECLQLYGKPAAIGKPQFVEDSICVTYSSKLQNMDFGEISINLLQSRPDSDNFTFSERLQNWTKARHVRLRLLQPHTLQGHHFLAQNEDDSFRRLIFYSLRDITILARCICHGHSNLCQWNSAVDRFECRCMHNTCGEECMRCCDGFVQFPWRPAYENVNFTCEPCNCFGHSHECVYNATIDRMGLSLDVAGRQRGGGVCLNCMNNTAGINCERCLPGYFRPKTSPLTSACEGCQCDTRGATSRNCTGTGHCTCHYKVEGKKCNRCVSGQWGFPYCTPCQCSTVGSRGTACDTKTGQCKCKDKVTGMNCDRCENSLILTVAGCLDCDNCSMTLKNDVSRMGKSLDVWLLTVKEMGGSPSQRLQWNFLKNYERKIEEIKQRLEHYSLGNVEIIINSDISHPIDGTLHSAVDTLGNQQRSNMKAAESTYRIGTNLANVAAHTLRMTLARYNESALFHIWNETRDLVDGILILGFTLKKKSKPKAHEQKSFREGQKLLSEIKMQDFSIARTKVEKEIAAAVERYRLFNGTCKRVLGDSYSCKPENHKSRLLRVVRSTSGLHKISSDILQKTPKIHALKNKNKAAVKRTKGRADDLAQFFHNFQSSRYFVSHGALFLESTEKNWLVIQQHSGQLRRNISKLEDILNFLRELPSKLKKSKSNSIKDASKLIRLSESLDAARHHAEDVIKVPIYQLLEDANKTALGVIEAVQFWNFNATKTLVRSKALQEWARFLLKLTQSASHIKPTVFPFEFSSGSGLHGLNEVDGSTGDDDDDDTEGSGSPPVDVSLGDGLLEDHIYIDERGDDPQPLNEKPLQLPALTDDLWLDEKLVPRSAIDQLRDMITDIKGINDGRLAEGIKCQSLTQDISANLKSSVKINDLIQTSIQREREFKNAIKEVIIHPVKTSSEYEIVQQYTWRNLRNFFAKTKDRMNGIQNKTFSLVKDICGEWKNCSSNVFQNAAWETNEFLHIVDKCKKSAVHLSISRPYMTLFEQVNKKIASLREKIALAKKISRSIKGPVRYISPGFTSPSLPEEVARPSAITKIELAIHSQYEDGLIFTTSNDSKSFQVSIILTGSRLDVCAVLHDLRKCTVLSTKIPIMSWFHLSLTRIGSEVSVVLITNDNVSSQGKIVWKSAANYIVPLSYPIYVGGIPEEIKSSKQNDFDGCLLLTLNDYSVSLMTSDVQRGLQEFCTDSCARSINAATVSFDGTGYHKMTLDTTLTPLSITFMFRTFEHGTLLLHVQGIKKNEYFTVWVEEGNILATYRERTETAKLSSQRRSYHDGKWHEVQIKQEGNVWSLVVDRSDRDSSAFLYFASDRPSTSLFLGGLDFDTHYMLPSWIQNLKNLTGCISNVTLLGKILNVQDFQFSRASAIGRCQLPNSNCMCLLTEQFALQPLTTSAIHFVTLSFKTTASNSSLILYKTSVHSSIHVFQEKGRLNVQVKSRHISGRYFDRDDRVLVNDGRWHNLLLIRNRNHSSTFIVDHFQLEFQDRLKEPIYESQHFLYLGGPFSSKTNSVCFKDVALNNRLVDLASKHHSTCRRTL